MSLAVPHREETLPSTGVGSAALTRGFSGVSHREPMEPLPARRMLSLSFEPTRFTTKGTRGTNRTTHGRVRDDPAQNVVRRTGGRHPGRGGGAPRECCRGAGHRPSSVRFAHLCDSVEGWEHRRCLVGRGQRPGASSLALRGVGASGRRSGSDDHGPFGSGRGLADCLGGSKARPQRPCGGGRMTPAAVPTGVLRRGLVFSRDYSNARDGVAGTLALGSVFVGRLSITRRTSSRSRSRSHGFVT